MATPIWKIYLGKEYRAACKYIEDAAALVAFLGDGATIRYDHRDIVWTEGAETQPAGESYDHGATVANGRVDALAKAVKAKRDAEAAEHERRHRERKGAAS